MNKTRVIPIFNQVDVHAARMYTREAARQIGMELIDQARISLATSSLAECLKMAPTRGGKTQELGSTNPLGDGMGETMGSQITIRFLEQNQVFGLQVDFSCPSNQQNECIQQQLEKVRTLVDEIRFDRSLEAIIQISLVKWCSRVTPEGVPAAGENDTNGSLPSNGDGAAVAARMNPEMTRPG